MPWYSKVAWTEGLFLRPQHLQQADRYHEHFVDMRVRQITPYPWGFGQLEIDRDLLMQGRFGLRRAGGLMPDGTPFDLPADGPLPPAIDIAETSGRQTLFLLLPLAVPGEREIADPDHESATRHVLAGERTIDAAAALRLEEDIDIAQPRFSLEAAATPKPGYAALAVARILEMRDRTLILDERFVPPLLVTAAHAVPLGWIDRVTGWIEGRLGELARYAADPTAGGGLQNADYLMLQILNRTLPLLVHLRASVHVHPERLYCLLLGLAGELATFNQRDRRARRYPAYNHDDLEATFTPLLRDIQDLLSYRHSRRALRLELQRRSENAFVATVRDPALFASASFVLEVAARCLLTDIQTRWPHVCKIGPLGRMQVIVNNNLPGIRLIHLPTPPTAIRAITDHVYFLLDKNSEYWPEFSQQNMIGLHFSGDWPALGLDLWAIQEDGE